MTIKSMLDDVHCTNDDMKWVMMLSAISVSMMVPLSAAIAIPATVSATSTSLCGPSEEIVHIPFIRSFVCSGSGHGGHAVFLGRHHVFSWSLVIVTTVRVHRVHSKSRGWWSVWWHGGWGCPTVSEFPDVITVGPIDECFSPNSISWWSVHSSLFVETSSMLHLVTASLSPIVIEVLSAVWPMPNEIRAPPKTPAISPLSHWLGSPSTAGRFPSFSCDGWKIHIFIGRKHFTQSLSTSWFHFLSISSNFYWLVVIPRIMKMLCLCKGKLLPVDPVKFKNST